MSVKELQKRNIDPALRAVIADSIQEILGDPDFGLELTTSAKRKLKVAIKDTRKGKTLAEIRAKYC
ncbi:MAG: hypothetical protein Q7S01_06315 [bacterium]|nr:hypothetical protein [bacterium]